MVSLRGLVKDAASMLGVDRAARRLNHSKLLICCYHGVRDDNDPARNWLMLSRAAFTDQMRYLKAHYRCLPLDEALRELGAGPLSSPVACVTFDDGYLNNRTVALPVLSELEIPATIYVATGFLGTRRTLWSTRLELALAQSPRRTIGLEPLAMAPVVVGAASGPTIARALIARLKEFPAPARITALEYLEAQLDAPVVPSVFAFMSWDDVRTLDASGLVTIAPHTVNHEILSRLSDAELAYEITTSVNDVATRLGRVVTTFAYPNGTLDDFDDRCPEVLQRVGCVAALSTREGLNDVGQDRFAMRRVVVGGAESMASFRLRCAGVARAT